MERKKLQTYIVFYPLKKKIILKNHPISIISEFHFLRILCILRSQVIVHFKIDPLESESNLVVEKPFTTIF